MGLSREYGHIRSLYWILASIIAACFGVTCLIGGLELDVEEYDWTKLYGTRLYKVFSWGEVVFTTASLVLGVIGIVRIIKDWKVRKISGTVELVGLICVGSCLLGFTLFAPEYYRMRRAISINVLNKITKISESISKYSAKTNHMPDAFGWCDSLINEPNIAVDEHDFHIGQLPHIECNFAFNKNLDNRPRTDIDNNVVLLFEVDGDLNLSGGPELIKKGRAKDKYFLLERQRFIYVLFVDGTIVKYRLRDGAIAKYDEKVNAFTAYVPKGKTAYSPLRWKP